MRLASLQIKGSVARSGILILKHRCYGLKGDILDYLRILIFWFIVLFYPLKG